MKAIKLILAAFLTVLSISSFTVQKSYSKTNLQTALNQGGLDYVPVLIENVWWMYVYEEDRLIYCYPIDDE